MKEYIGIGFILLILLIKGIHEILRRRIISLNKKAMSLHQAGKFDEAIHVAHKALALIKMLVSGDDAFVANTLVFIANIYSEDCNPKKAVMLMEDALQIYNKVPDSQLINAAESMGNLAILYMNLGKYKQAEHLYKRLLEIAINFFPAKHPNLAISHHNLAVFYDSLGKYAEAENSIKKALHILEPTQDTGCLLTLSHIYFNQGKYIEAEALCQQILPAMIEEFGCEDIYVAACLNNLSEFNKEVGKYVEAEAFCLRALAIKKKHSGPNDHHVGVAMNKLAELYRLQGKKMTEAENLSRQGIEIIEKRLGDKHFELVRSLENLSYICLCTDRLHEAEKLSKRGLSINKQTLGDKHPDFARSLYHLGDIHNEQGLYSRAKDLYKRALKIREKTLPPDHPTLLKNKEALRKVNQKLKIAK